MSLINSPEISIEVIASHIPDMEIQKPYQYFFSYQITILNRSSQPVQLVSRYWQILDGGLQQEIVKGLGVVGQQPILEPNTSFTYTSGCPLMAEFGKMSGHYTFLNLANQETFQVEIPAFSLTTTFSQN
ncbi:MAG: Co2+/Mg2+ efflux protein ApaG [Bacteroidota bacterium]